MRLMAAPQRHLERVANQLRGHALGHRPAHDATRVEVNDQRLRAWLSDVETRARGPVKKCRRDHGQRHAGLGLRRAVPDRRRACERDRDAVRRHRDVRDDHRLA